MLQGAWPEDNRHGGPAPVGEDAAGLKPVGQILTQDYRVLSARDGRQALGMLEEYSFRLIFKEDH